MMVFVTSWWVVYLLSMYTSSKPSQCLKNTQESLKEGI